MHPTKERQVDAAEWMQPLPEQQGLRRYAQTLRERFWLIVLAVAITTGVAIAYVATTPKTYEAEAGILVSPVPPEDQTASRLGLPSRSADPLREIQTVAALLTTNEVAERVQRSLDDVPEAEGDPEALLQQVSAEPVAESNIVAVTATAGDPDDAAEIANAFVQGLIDQRTDELHQRIDDQLTQLEARLTADPSSNTLRREIAELEVLSTRPDPTIGLATEAFPDATPVAPRPLLSVAGGLLAGLVLGITAAFAYETIDPRLRREDQLRRLYRLPILARIPKEARRPSDSPLAPTSLSPAASEAYRTLRGTLSISSPGPAEAGRAILVTGSSPSEGKTTTAVNLATSLAAAGKSVILIEADLRRPAIAGALRVRPEAGVVSVLIENTRLEDALMTTATYGSNLGLLLADYEGDWISELFALPAARRMITAARRLADFVIIDSPPLTDVIDALPLAEYADQVLIVTRLGRTRLPKLAQLGELLAENGIRPAGFAVVGTARPTRSDYHYYGERERRLLRTNPEAESAEARLS